MAYPPEIRAAARAAYIYQRMAIKDIATQYGVAEGVVRTWRRQAEKSGDDWDSARAAAGLSREGQLAVAAAVLEDFVTFFRATIQRLRDRPDSDPLEVAQVLARLSDAYSKMMASAGKVATPISRLSVALETLRELSLYIAAERPDALPTFADLLDGFGAILTEKMARG